MQVLAFSCKRKEREPEVIGTRERVDIASAAIIQKLYRKPRDNCLSGGKDFMSCNICGRGE